MENIIRDFDFCEKHLRIYIYDFYPPGFRSLREFISHVKADEDYRWGETYKSWVYFTDSLLNSPIYTDDENKADLFLVLTWENYHKGEDYKNDLIAPLKNAIDSIIYKKTNPLRNHIFIYISDDTPLFDIRIPKAIRKELKRRFIRLTYSGRIPHFGRYHTTWSAHTSGKLKSIFNYNYQNEIVLPCGIPVEYPSASASKHREATFYYLGTLDPPRSQIERRALLQLIQKDGRIVSDTCALFGIHAAGFGIWTARFYNYLQMNMIPVFQSDGVIMPFERFFNYESICIKLLSHSRSNLRAIKYLSQIDTSALETDEMKQLSLMLENIEEVKDYFSWRSTHRYRNPFSLTMIELYDYVKINRDNAQKITKKSYIAKEEFYRLDNKMPDLYRKVTSEQKYISNSTLKPTVLIIVAILFILTAMFVFRLL